MRVTIMGTGGVGGYFGARLANAGCDVTFVARGAQLAALRERGLRIESPLGGLHLPKVRATDEPAGIGETDLVLFGVKLWDTAFAAESIKPLVGEQTAVVSFQNGVVKDDILRAALGASQVLGGVCYIAATLAEPGVIRHSGNMQKLVFGEYDGKTSARVTRFRDACAAAGIEHELSGCIRQTIWEKFVFLVGLSGATATTRMSIGAIRGNQRARAFLRDIMDEAVQVARAEGVALPVDYASDRLAFCDQLPTSMTSSMHNDLERGSRLEVPWLSGDVVSRGERLGIATPCNRAVLDILSVHVEGRPG
ncbi:MAG: 2-dehydropantoate 2-reductase [Methylibium sp.]|uniref:ketopantoate reductase family protein n=1 Tax=Methylibium sp. TaxID=2067992 RepID=UPI0017D5A8D1|nr:2-dehydropantoate 2-reductase [Methylibium sp.]MBA3595983.1 2-dehydropantoate 2-reductase [Methylibium sp.]